MFFSGEFYQCADGKAELLLVSQCSCVQHLKGLSSEIVNLDSSASRRGFSGVTLGFCANFLTGLP